MYSREEIEKVRSAVDIVEVVREYVPSLNVTGRSAKGLCPFHGEKTPSFHLQPEKGFFKCFGCGEAGDVIAFISKIEQVSFTEALERLASQAGLVLKKERVSKEKVEPEGIREKLWRILETAKNFYIDQLRDDKAGEAARAYLQEREIRDDTIRDFQLGFAPTSGESIIEVLVRKNYSIELCQQAGLAVRSAAGRFGSLATASTRMFATSRMVDAARGPSFLADSSAGSGTKTEFLVAGGGGGASVASELLLVVVQPTRPENRNAPATVSFQQPSMVMPSQKRKREAETSRAGCATCVVSADQLNSAIKLAAASTIRSRVRCTG